MEFKGLGSRRMGGEEGMEWSLGQAEASYHTEDGHTAGCCCTAQGKLLPARVSFENFRLWFPTQANWPCVSKSLQKMQTGVALIQVSVILTGPTRQNCLLNGGKRELSDLGTEMQEKGPQSRSKHWHSFFLPSFRNAAAQLTFLLKTHVYRLHELSSSLRF